MRHLNQTALLIAAILLSPIAGVFLESLSRDIFLLFTLDFESWLHNFPAFIVSGFAKAILGLFISIPVVVLYGLPVFYLLRKLDLQNIWMFGLFGLLPTGLGLLAYLFGLNPDFEKIGLYSVTLGALDGFYTAICFWFIAVYIPSRAKDDN